MQDQPKSIALICNDPEVSDALKTALAASARARVDASAATLCQLNGAAVKLAASHDLVIFRTEADLDRDIRAVEELRGALGHPARIVALSDPGISLGEARRLTQAGVDEVLPFPMSEEDLADQVRRWTRPAPGPNLPAHYAGQPREGHVVTVAQARGGIGATTLAVNLADRLLDPAGRFRKQARNKVALVDLDLQFGAVASLLDLEPSEAFYSMAAGGVVPDATFLRQAMASHRSGVSVLTAPTRFVPLDALSAGQVGQLVDLLKREYDYVVIDLPRTLVDWVAPILARTDRMLLVTDTSVPSVRQARRLIDFYTEEHLGLPIEVVVAHEKKPLIAPRHHVEAAKILERKLGHWIPYDPAAAREAADRGMPLSAAAGRSPVARAIRALGRDTLATLSTPQTVTSKNIH